MTYTTIQDAIKVKKGNIVAKITKLGEIKTGTTKNGQNFRRQTIHIEDNSATFEMTVWDEFPFPVGSIVKIESPFWKEYQGKTQLSPGQYCKMSLGTEADMIPAQTPPGQTHIQTQTTEQYFSDEMDRGLRGEIEAIHGLEMLIRDELMKKDNEAPAPKVGMYLKILIDSGKFKL